MQVYVFFKQKCQLYPEKTFFFALCFAAVHVSLQKEKKENAFLIQKHLESFSLNIGKPIHQQLPSTL